MAECIVEVKQGKLRGKCGIDDKGGTYYSFQGIPYAKPPTGILRFKAPLPAVKRWPGVRDATKEADFSVSRDEGLLTGSEDCLYLNIFTPQLCKEEKERLPVLVFVHGGQFLFGSPSQEMYGPEYLISENIIVVTIGYRLGILGFLSLEDPTLGVPGNAALKDVVLALEWLQSNIEVFCGDPQNVTLAGHSAGSALIHFLILSPMSRGLFQRAMLMSGCALHHWSIATRKSKELCKLLGVDSETERDLLDILRQLKVKELLELQEKIHKQFPHACEYISFAPVIESNSNEPVFLDKHPLDIIKSGNYNKVPILVGYASLDGRIAQIIYEKPKLGPEYNFEVHIPNYFNIEGNSNFSRVAARKIKESYFGNASRSNGIFDNYYIMQTDILILHGTQTAITNHLKNLNCPIYFYKFSLDTSLNLTKQVAKLQHRGACHGDELGYIFKNNCVSPSNDTEKKYIDIIVKLWTSFVKTGNPNPLEKDSLINITWEPVKEGKFNYLDINDKLTTGVNLDIERLIVWDELSFTNPYKSLYN